MHRLLLLLLLPFLASSQLVCPSGFTLRNGNKCLRLIKNSLKHAEAETDCKYLGGTLANVNNAIDNRAVSQLAASAGVSNIWLGLYCFNNSSSSCFWDNASGNAGNYSQFVAGHPQIAGGFGGCVYMTTSNGQWVSAKCEVVGFPFVCETPPTYNDTCTHNYAGNCYFPSQDFAKKSRNLTYSDAQSYCKSMSSNLVSIHTKMELDYIKTIYRDSSTNVSQIFLGAKASLPEVFNWNDGSQWDLDYSNPLNKTQANCMVMDTQGAGLWSQVNCQTVNFFLCKRPAGSSSSLNSGAFLSSQKPQKPQVLQKLTVDVSDFSNCNSTFQMAPGIFTSPNYPSNYPITYCTYNLKALGPYNLAIYFTDINNVYGDLYVYDESGNTIMSSSYQNVAIASTNIATVTFSWNGFGYSSRGFDATFLAI